MKVIFECQTLCDPNIDFLPRICSTNTLVTRPDHYANANTSNMNESAISIKIILNNFTIICPVIPNFSVFVACVSFY